MAPFKKTTYYACSSVLAALLLASCSQTGHGDQQQTASAVAPEAGTAAGQAVATVTPFPRTVPTNPGNTQCALDLVNDQPAGQAAAISNGSTVIFGGWAGNGQGQAANRVALVLKGADHAYSVPITINVARPDVAKALNSAGMANSGYNLSTTLNGVAAGNYSLYVVNPSDASADCDLHRTLKVQ